jgi:hypothetical protein
MAHIEDRHLKIVPQPSKYGRISSFPIGIEGGQRLIGQQQRRAATGAPGRSRRAASRRPKVPRTPVEQPRDPAGRRSGRTPPPASSGPWPGGREPATIGQVPAHVEMRKQPRLLKHVAHAALVRWHEDARGAVEEHRCHPVGNTPAIRLKKPRHCLDHARFSRPRRPKRTVTPPGASKATSSVKAPKPCDSRPTASASLDP